MADNLHPPTRLMNFVTEEQLDEAKRTRGERVEDGTAQRDRPLYEILKENKDKQDAEFNERFKHRPPKSLDEDETEFLDKLEMSRKEYEQQIADAEAQELQRFQAAVAAQSLIVHKVKETLPVNDSQDQKSIGKKNPAARPLGMIIKVKPQAKKAKLNQSLEDLPDAAEVPEANVQNSTNLEKSFGDRAGKSSVTSNSGVNEEKPCHAARTGLVSYSDESEED